MKSPKGSSEVLHRAFSDCKQEAGENVIKGREKKLETRKSKVVKINKILSYHRKCAAAASASQEQTERELLVLI